MNKNITFQPIKFWAKIPHGIWLREATSVAVDSKDNVYIYNRGNIPLLIFNSSGDLISNWGNEDPLGNIKILEGSKIIFGVLMILAIKFISSINLLSCF